MNQQKFATKNLKPLLPSALTKVSEGFKENIRQNGIVVPLVICGGIVCDGHQRLKAATELGIDQLKCIEATGSPGLLFAILNSHKELSAYEAAAIFSHLDHEEKDKFMILCGFSESPQMRFALNFIAEQILPEESLFEYALPVNVWRELGHLDLEIGRFARSLLLLPGTTGEKRNIAALLRQLHRRNELPEKLPGETAAEVIASLQGAAQPRRTATLDKFNKALANAKLPPAVIIKIDPTLSQPGMQVIINITRRTTQRLVQVKEAVENIFSDVEEL